MARYKLRLEEQKKEAVFDVYRFDNETQTEKLVSIINTTKKPSIRYFLDDFVVEEILIEGRCDFPKGVSSLGKMTSVMGKIKNNLSSLHMTISSFTISDTRMTSIINSENGLVVVFNTNDIEELSKKKNFYNRIASSNLNISTQELLHQKALTFFPNPPKAINLSKNVFMDNLKDSIKNDLTADDVKKLGDFYIEASTKFVRKDIKRDLLIDLQDKTKIIALENIIEEYEKLLKDEPAESAWQDFFNTYITILDSRYIKKLDKNNISSYTTKKPDLILLDLYNFVDIYELKKTTTSLLEYDNSHKNYYWHKDIAKVIAQAEKYLRKICENSNSFIREVKDDCGIEIDIVRPKAIIVAGHSKYLDTKGKINDFKLLRESLKDISFIMYDEFYEKLKNFCAQIGKSK